MASQTVVGSLTFLMALNTESHGVIDYAFSNGHFCHISVARRTLHLCTDMRCVIETDVSFIRPSVNALPWNFLAARFICGNLLDLGFICCDRLVAHHAVLHARYACHRTLRYPSVAEITFELCDFNMRFVLVRDWLNGLAPYKEEVAYCFAQRRVRGRKYLRRLRKSGSRGLSSQRNGVIDQQPRGTARKNSDECRDLPFDMTFPQVREYK